MDVTSRSRVRRAVDLDQPDSYQHLDLSGMLGLVVDFPAQVEDAARIGAAFASEPANLAEFRDPKLIVLAGMGGSAVGGDLLARLIEKRTPVPFLVCRDYDVPASVGPDTLFIAGSYSGNTEETLSATTAALAKGARVLCITTGGKVAALAREHSRPLISIPGDKPMPPRYALPYSLIPLVVVFEALGLYPDAGKELAETVPLLRSLASRCSPEVPTDENPAKQLAAALYGKIPVIQGTVGLMAGAAYRWRTQFNENADMLAISSEYSELDHNECVGWELPPHMGQWFEVVTLVRRNDCWRQLARVEITQAMVLRRTGVHTVVAEGESPLAQLLWTVLLGDFVTVYSAYLYEVDPKEINNIVSLKESLDRLREPADMARLRPMASG